jgi:TonB-linked SusC/RagA family outer membrane protein
MIAYLNDSLMQQQLSPGQRRSSRPGGVLVTPLLRYAAPTVKTYTMMKGLLSFLLALAACMIAPATQAQSTGAVSGTVTSSKDQEPIAGVSVAVKGTRTGTVTDSSGRYELRSVGSRAVLVFSYVGFVEKEISVSGQRRIDVTLEEKGKALNEVVVIGYGRQSRATLSTSISKVSATEFEAAPAANPLLQLQGKVAGVNIQASNGQPGSNPQIFIRGGASTAPEGDAPLFIVDGIVGQMRNISDLNPDDIESMQILKDAASTSIYGAAAANGVIIVKTKSGVKGKTRIHFKASTGIDQQARRYDFVNARDYIYVSRKNTAQFNKTNPEFFLSGGTYGMSTGNPRNSKNTLEFLDTYITSYGEDYVAHLIDVEGWEVMDDPVTGKKLIFKNTNYQDVTFQDASRQEYDLNVSGGTDRATYYVSLGHLNQDGIVSGTFYKNYSGLFNGNFKLSDKWSVNTNISYQVRNSTGPNNINNVLSRSVTMPPTYRMYYEDGTPAPGEGIASFRSRHHEVFYKEKYTDVSVYRSTFNLGANWDILPGLKFTPTFYWYTTEGLENYFEASNETNRNRNASADHNLDRQTQIDGLFTYDRDLFKKHHLNAVAGASYINRYVYRMASSGRGAPTDYIPTVNATAPETQRTSTTRSTDIMMSYFGRVNYDIKRKYLFSANLRADGSSRFAEAHKWGVFPGVSAGWNLHLEDFFDPLSRYLSTFKLRASWGQVGNNELSIGDSQGAYSTGSSYQGGVGILNTTLANSNLIWETTTSFDAGVDIGLFNNRVTLLLDYYSKVTSDRLFSKPLDATSGFASIRSNYGSIRSRGFEAELSTTPVRTKSFSWDVAATFAFNKSIVLELPDNGEEKNRIGGNWVFDPASGQYVKVGGLAEGEEFGGRWAFQMLGVYATDKDAEAAPYDVNAAGRRKVGGDAIWADLDGNGRIENTDMIFMGYIRPNITGGMVNTLKFKGLTARFVVDYAVGHVIDNGFRSKANGSSRNNNVALTDVLSNAIWKEQGDVATIPRYTVQSDFDYGFRNHQRDHNNLGNSGTASNSTLYYSKGDYLAFREVSLSYQLRSRWLSRLYLQGVEVFGGLYNIGYLTEYDGLMPEVFTGVDPGLYPRPRHINFGLKASF